MLPYSLEKLLKNTYPEPNTGCWLWGGLIDKDGYGRVSPKKHKLRNAHRLSYFFHKGDFDRSLFVCHTCDQPSCINPDHLFLGTVQENSDDMKNKKRQARGEQQWKAKLDTIDIKNIRILYGLGIYSCKEIGRFFSVSDVNVHSIVTYKIWKK